MVLEILIATVEGKLDRIAQMLLPERNDVRYLVSCQYCTPLSPTVPPELEKRTDVRVMFMQGRGLSRNRNNTLLHAKGDILLIADDDEQLYEEGLATLLHTYEKNPEVDIALFKVDGLSKKYPNNEILFQQKDFLGAYYVSSVEMTMRRTAFNDLRFNEQFGLGSSFLGTGEEQVFLFDALQRNLLVKFFPIAIASTTPGTTGQRFLTDERVQRAKGATFCYLFGKRKAQQLCMKESAYYLLHKAVNPLRLFQNMNSGINYALNLLPPHNPRFGTTSVSIIIPVYNRAKYLPTLFRSLERITYPNLHVIFIDNNSDDNSLELCNNFSLSTSIHTRVVQEDKPGASRARNMGLQLCETEWVYFFDSDDVLSADFLDHIMPLTENRDAIFFTVVQEVKGQSQHIHDYVDTSAELNANGRSRSLHDVAAHIITSMLNTQSMLLRTEWLRSIGGWNNQLPIWNDYELGVRVLLNKPRYIWFTDKPFHHINIHSASITGSTMSNNLTGKVRCLQQILSYISTPSDLISPREQKRLSRALYLRSMIFQGILIRESKTNCSKMTEVLPQSLTTLFNQISLSPTTCVLGCFLRFFTSIGGRGAWRIALKTI